MNRFFIKSELKNYGFIVLGSLFLSLAVVGFFAPNQMITGGTAGLALLLHYISPLSVGSLIILINIPLLIIGNKYLGKIFVVKTIITLVLISFFIDFITHVINLKPFILDTSLSAIFGGIFVGIGLALVIKAGSSAGGSTVLSRIVSSKTEIKAAQVILVIDLIILIAALFIIEDTAKVLWSIISIYITTKVIDTILTGNLNKKVVYLVTQKTEELKKEITDNLGSEGTILKGDGLFEGQEKKMILIVVEVTKLQKLRQMVKIIDPDAFLIISEASEMLGREG